MKILGFELKSKQVVPIALAIIFLGSVLAVFGQSSTTGGTATLIVDFGQPNMRVEKKVTLIKDMNVVNMVSSNVRLLTLTENGSINCLNDYCLTETGAWSAYKVTNITSSMGYPLDGALEKIKVQKGDTILLRYNVKMFEETAEQITNSTESNLTENSSTPNSI